MITVRIVLLDCSSIAARLAHWALVPWQQRFGTHHQDGATGDAILS